VTARWKTRGSAPGYRLTNRPPVGLSLVRQRLHREWGATESARTRLYRDAAEATRQMLRKTGSIAPTIFPQKWKPTPTGRFRLSHGSAGMKSIKSGN